MVISSVKSTEAVISEDNPDNYEIKAIKDLIYKEEIKSVCSSLLLNRPGGSKSPIVALVRAVKVRPTVCAYEVACLHGDHYLLAAGTLYFFLQQDIMGAWKF